jgi:adenylate cyclase
VVDSPGDNLLAEFLSVVDAVRCAVEIQEELRIRNAELPENRRMEFRIGINLGDVVQEEERIYGDGINIAARVEGIAEGGGICISGTVYDSIKNKLSLSYEPLGEHTVKNIKEPVRVYRMRIGPEAATPVVREEKAGPRRWQKAALGAVAVLVVLAGAWAIWNFYFRPTIEPASKEKMAFPLPDQPSIAVLPFDNLSGDPKQEYFSDGLTEDLISALSRVPSLFVISRKSTFTYKGKPVKVQQVSEELGVRYVLEGSVRKAEDRVRITAQLVDAVNGRHLWSGRYDRDLKDIFALQDEITMKVITELQVKLVYGHALRITARGTKNFEAYLKLLEGWKQMEPFNRENNAAARRLFEEAIALDPKFAAAYSWAGITHIFDVPFKWTNSPKQSLAKAEELLDKALTIDPSYPACHTSRSIFFRVTGKHEKAVAAARKAVDLAPNYSFGNSMLGAALVSAGKYEESIQFLKKATRLDPVSPSPWYELASGYNRLGQCEEAIRAGERARALSPKSLISHVRLTEAYLLCGREEEARASAAEVMRINPKYSWAHWSKRIKFKNQADKERYIENLRKAGLK